MVPHRDVVLQTLLRSAVVVLLFVRFFLSSYSARWQPRLEKGVSRQQQLPSRSTGQKTASIARRRRSQGQFEVDAQSACWLKRWDNGRRRYWRVPSSNARATAKGSVRGHPPWSIIRERQKSVSSE